MHAQIILRLHKKGCVCVCVSVGTGLNSSQQDAGQDTVWESCTRLNSDRIRRGAKDQGFCSRHGLDPDVVPVSSFLKENGDVCVSPPLLHSLTSSPICKMGRLFSSLWWVEMCSSCRNSITPFSNNVNIVQLLFFSSLPRGDSLFLLKEAQTLGKTSGRMQRTEAGCYLF